MAYRLCETHDPSNYPRFMMDFKSLKCRGLRGVSKSNQFSMHVITQTHNNYHMHDFFLNKTKGVYS